MQAVVALLALQLGWGVFLFPAAFAKLGWATCLASIAVLAALTCYSGFLFARLFQMTPGAVIFGDIGERAAGSFGRTIVYVVVYTMAASRTIILHQAAAESLSYIFPREQMPTPWHSGAAVLVVMAALVQVRKMSDLSWVFLCGTASQFVAICIVVYELLSFPDRDPVYKAQAVTWDTLLPSVVAFFNVVFAFGGQSAFVEIMSSMTQPSDFPGAVTASTVLITVLYVTIGLVGYRSHGASAASVILFELGHSPRVRFANCCILLQAASQYLANLNLWTHNLLVLLARRHSKGAAAAAAARSSIHSDSDDSDDTSSQQQQGPAGSGSHGAGNVVGKAAGKVTGKVVVSGKAGTGLRALNTPQHQTASTRVGGSASAKAGKSFQSIAGAITSAKAERDSSPSVPVGGGGGGGGAGGQASLHTTPKADSRAAHTPSQWFGISLFVLSYSYVVSSGFPYFSSLVSLFTSSTFLVCAYVLPAWFSLRLLGKRMSWQERLLLRALIPACLALSVVGLYGSIQSLIRDIARHPMWGSATWSDVRLYEAHVYGVEDDDKLP